MVLLFAIREEVGAERVVVTGGVIALIRGVGVQSVDPGMSNR